MAWELCLTTSVPRRRRRLSGVATVVPPSCFGIGGRWYVRSGLRTISNHQRQPTVAGRASAGSLACAAATE